MCLKTVPCFIPSRSASSTINSPSPREISSNIRQRIGLPRPEASAANGIPAGTAGADGESDVVLMEIPSNLPETASNSKPKIDPAARGWHATHAVTENALTGIDKLPTWLLPHSAVSLSP